MKVLMLLEREFPPDNRVEKEIQSLLEDGHKVDIACYTMRKTPTIEHYRGYTIFRKAIHTITYKLSAAALICPVYFAFWKKFIAGLIKKYGYDVLHVHDLPLTKVATQIAHKYGLKVVCDQHEFYSNWINYTAHYNNGIGKFVKCLSNWKGYEKKYLNKANLVITVEEPLRNNYIEQVHLLPEKIIVTPNTPSLEIFSRERVKPEIVKKYENNVVLFYAGGIDILRGLNLAVDALKTISKSIPGIKLVLAGTVNKGYNIKQRIANNGVEHLVDFIGWVDIEDLPSYIAASTICLFTPQVNRDEINKTVATKIYQYLAMGKPIITSQAKLMQAFVQKHNIGIAVDHTDVEGFANAVVKIYSDKAWQGEIAQKSRAIAENYFWEKTVMPMINAYNNL